MAFDGTRPASSDYIAEAPALIQENQRALKDDQIVNAGKLKGYEPGNSDGNIPVSNGNLCKNLNAEKLGNKYASAFAEAGHTHPAVTTTSNGLMTNSDKVKLDSIATGAQVNQNAFSVVSVGGTLIQADNQTDTLELNGGSNITITPDAANDRLTIAVTGTVPNAVNATNATNATNAVNATNATNATNAASATNAAKLATARIMALTGGVTGSTSFDGSANVSIATTIAGNAPTATKLATARTINGVAFDGSQNITVTATANGGTASACSGNAATATKLQTARTISLNGTVIGSGFFDGSGNLAITTSVGNVSPRRQLFTASGTFTVPNGVTEVWVTIAGAGGGGGSGSTDNPSDGPTEDFWGGSGGRGQVRWMNKVTVIPGEVISITIGSGGEGRTGTGGTGGTSFFGSYLSALGGSGGRQYTSGTNGGVVEIDLSYGSGGGGGLGAGSRGSNGQPGMCLVEW